MRRRAADGPRMPEGSRYGEKRSTLYRSLCGHALWLRHLEEPDDWTPITVKPQYVFRDREIINRDVAKISKRFSKRMGRGANGADSKTARARARLLALADVDRRDPPLLGKTSSKL